MLSLSNLSVDLSIVIVNWNSREYLKKCIASIVAQTHTMRYEIVVIDSGSFDGCDRMLAEHYPQVRFVHSPDNLGFARANNCAFEASVGACVLFLNPDTELVGPAIDTLYASFLALPDAGVAGCRLLNGDGTVQSSCIQSIPTIANQVLDSQFLRNRWPRSSLWGMAPLFEECTSPRPVEAVSGACLMVMRETFEQVSRFTEEYFMYVEDMDLSAKVRAIGRRNYYVSGATVIHYGGSSSEQAVSAFAAVMIREAVWRFLRRTRGRAYGAGYRVGMLASAAARLSLLALAGGGRRPSVSLSASRQKWVAVLRWSVHRDDIVWRYYRARDVGQGASADWPCGW